MKFVTTKDPLQNGYKYYLSEAVGKNFDPEFRSELTPREMLKLGVFGGYYFRSYIDEYPKSWFKGVKLSPEFKDPKLNYFKINASQPLKYWQDRGWINPQDPRGWFQWYCRYYMGRRTLDDERQIARWKAVVRHISQLQKNCRPRDLSCRPRQRQALLHWAYDSRKI